jgi:hypothetical protein
MPNSEDNHLHLTSNSNHTQKQRIQFRVEGLPPNQKSKPSIWSDVVQSLSVIELRKQALLAKKNSRVIDFFTSKIRLELEIFAPKNDLDTIGDLNNLLGGVCDGLQAKPNNPTLKLAEWFSFPENLDVCPDIPIFYNDDKVITSIEGTKIETEKDPYYIIKIFEL